MATRGQQWPSLTPPWEPLNFPEAGPSPTGWKWGRGPVLRGPTRPLTTQQSRHLRAGSLQLPPVPAPRPLPGPLRRCPPAGQGRERRRAKLRAAPVDPPPLDGPAPERCRRVGRGPGQSEPPAPAAQLEAVEQKVSGAPTGGWRGVVGTDLGEHFPSSRIAPGAAQEGVPGQLGRAPRAAGQALSSPELSNQSPEPHPFLRLAFPDLPSRARDTLGFP